MRLALACAQITAPKDMIKDGFSKMIVKADWDKLRNRELVPQVLQAEALMLAGWEMIQQSQPATGKDCHTFWKISHSFGLAFAAEGTERERTICYTRTWQLSKPSLRLTLWS